MVVENCSVAHSKLEGLQVAITLRPDLVLLASFSSLSGGRRYDKGSKSKHKQFGKLNRHWPRRCTSPVDQNRKRGLGRCSREWKLHVHIKRLATASYGNAKRSSYLE